MRRLIGLIPLVDEGRDSLWMLPGYMNGIRAAGGLPVMLPLESEESALDQFCAMCDGILLTGGHDVSPELYGQERLPVCGATSPQRDRMEVGILKRAMEAEKPVLGICRGIQLINAMLGGTLWQDLPSQRPSAITHQQRPPYDAPAHSVTLLKDTPLSAMLACDTLDVNSYHHQAIRRLAEPLQPMALSPDGLVEAVWHPQHRFLWGVQWHPEFSYRSDPAELKIFEAFVRACDG